MGFHDIDEPAEVIAAADRFHAAATAVTDRLAGTLRELVLPRRAESSLDRELAARLGRVTAAFGRVVAGQARRADESHRAAVEAVRALEDADRAGAQQLREPESA